MVFLRVTAILVMLISLIYASFNTFSTYSERSHLVSASLELSKMNLEQLRMSLDAEIDAKLESMPSSEQKEFIAINTKLGRLETRIEEVSDQTLGLRQAINPTKPDEVLKIARITDEINSLKNKLKSAEKNIVEQQKIFQESILREMKASNDSTTLILMVLFPLVMNFLYTVWKDIKDKKLITNQNKQ